MIKAVREGVKEGVRTSERMTLGETYFSEWRGLYIIYALYHILMTIWTSSEQVFTLLANLF